MQHVDYWHGTKVDASLKCIMIPYPSVGRQLGRYQLRKQSSSSICRLSRLIFGTNSYRRYLLWCCILSRGYLESNSQSSTSRILILPIHWRTAIHCCINSSKQILSFTSYSRLERKNHQKELQKNHLVILLPLAFWAWPWRTARLYIPRGSWEFMKFFLEFHSFGVFTPHNDRMKTWTIGRKTRLSSSRRKETQFLLTTTKSIFTFSRSIW